MIGKVNIVLYLCNIANNICMAFMACTFLVLLSLQMDPQSPLDPTPDFSHFFIGLMCWLTLESSGKIVRTRYRLHNGKLLSWSGHLPDEITIFLQGWLHPVSGSISVVWRR